MLDIILLYFLAKSIGQLASKKGLPALRWKIIMIMTWFGFEIIGLMIGLITFGMGNIYALMAFGIACAFGGYLVIRYILENKPDINSMDDIDSIGRIN